MSKAIKHYSRARCLAVMAAILIIVMVTVIPAMAGKVFVNGKDTTSDAAGCGSLANPCNNIQTGVDNAAVGDTVIIKPGVYGESVTIATDGLTLVKWPLKRGRVIIDAEDVPPACDDPARTIFAEGSQPCRQFDGDQASCDAAFAVSRELGIVSCWWNAGSCQGCGPDNQRFGNCVNTCGLGGPHGILVKAKDVSLKNLTVRNGILNGIYITSGATGATLVRVKASGPDRNCVKTDADGTSIINNTLMGCGLGCFNAAGNNITVRESTLGRCDNLLVRGQNTRILNNNMSMCDDDCIQVFGSGIEVTGNTVRGSDDEGIIVVSDRLTILDNIVTATADEVFDITCAQMTCADPTRTVFAGGPYEEACRWFADQASCEAAWALNDSIGAVSCFWRIGKCRGCGPNNQPGCTNTCTDAAARCTGLVRGNKASWGAEDECFQIQSAIPGLRVVANTALNCNDEGFNIWGNEVQMLNNITRGSGADGAPGITIEGDNNTVKGNVSKGNNGDGFQVYGDNNVLQANIAKFNIEGGIVVNTGDANRLLNNTANKNNLAGIFIDSNASNTEVTGNTALKNRVDFYNLGTGTTASGNTFGTTGP